MLCDDDFICLWSLQSPAAPNTNNNININTSTTTTSTTERSMRNVWECEKPHREDPMQMLFGSRANMDSGITSPHSERPLDDELNLLDASNEELRRRIAGMLKKPGIDEEDKQCLQQVLSLVQQLDALSQRSGPDSLNTTSSSDEASSLDLVKSRISDYSSASSSSSARSTYDNGPSPKTAKSTAQSTNSRIVATVQPYNSSPQHQQPIHAPTNTPTDSPRKTRQPWQSNSLSESGVFVESDFLSDASEQNACTQTDFDEEAKDGCLELQRLQRYDSKAGGKSIVLSACATYSPNLSEHKRLQYYKERLELLESKVLIYESSGDLQTKRLADRLQREIQLVKQLKELQDRVDLLECENATLEEEKCEFEEAENDTRLRLQRLEVELEILSQRNVELEMSREALSAKYKDCRSNCLILRDDLSVSETQIRHLEEDKQKAKENLEFLHSTLPLLLIYSSVITYAPAQLQPELKAAPATITEMGNLPAMPTLPGIDQNATDCNCNCNEGSNASKASASYDSCGLTAPQMETSACQERELTYLKEEVKCLRHQLKELNARHYEALESADSHWVDIEREYKDREESFRAKEVCLKQKIQKLQDCLRDDARAANEKILQLEDAEKELKCCLLRISKEHREILDEHQNVIAEYERFKEQYEQLQEQQKPLTDAFEQEKKRNKSLSDELNFMRKIQQETDARSLAEMDILRMQLFDLKKEFLHIEVTNSELKEEVATLEQQIETLQQNEKESVDKIRCLQDEVRSKEEMCQKLEKRLEHSEGYSLAQELSGSPSKRFKREDIKDLKSASQGLGHALRNMKECEQSLPSHHQFQTVARDVKKLADVLLHGDSLEDEILQQIEEQINEELMNFHSRKMESEFYCTVYYPVKRQLPLDITDFLI